MTLHVCSKDFIHPEDEAARRNLEAIPGFSSILKSFLRMGVEQLLHGLNMANKIRLSEAQLPDLYKRLPPICAKLGITEPEFYLEMNPVPNAYTFGDTRIFLTVTSGLLEYLDDDEIEAVIAHECGHIACRHVLYHTMARGWGQTLIIDQSHRSRFNPSTCLSGRFCVNPGVPTRVHRLHGVVERYVIAV